MSLIYNNLTMFWYIWKPSSLNKYADRDKCMYFKHLLLLDDHQSVWVIQQYLHLQIFSFSFYNCLSKSLVFLHNSKTRTRGHSSAWIIWVTTFSTHTSNCQLSPGKDNILSINDKFKTYQFLSHKILFTYFHN